MKRFFVSLLFVPAVSFASVSNEFFSGKDLLEYMDGRPWQQQVAMGYAQGIYDAHVYSAFCPHGGVNAGEVHDSIKVHLEKQGARLRHTASQLALEALRAQWPCIHNIGRRW